VGKASFAAISTAPLLCRATSARSRHERSPSPRQPGTSSPIPATMSRSRPAIASCARFS